MAAAGHGHSSRALGLLSNATARLVRSIRLIDKDVARPEGRRFGNGTCGPEWPLAGRMPEATSAMSDPAQGSHRGVRGRDLARRHDDVLAEPEQQQASGVK
jgi:hypothetical protein